MGFKTFFLYKFIPTVYQDPKRMLLLSLIVTVTLFLGKLAHLYSDYAAPLAAGVLLSTVLLGAKTGFMISVVLGALFGVIAGFDLRPVLMIILGSWMGVFALSRIDHGYSLPRTGIWMALVQAVTVLAIGLLEAEGQKDSPAITAVGLFDTENVTDTGRRGLVCLVAKVIEIKE